MDETDECLARRAGQGDERAFVELVRRCEATVANLIRLDAVKLRTWMEKDPAFGMLWMHQTSQQLLLRLNIVRVQLAAAWA